MDNFSVSVGNIVELLDDVRRDVNSDCWTTSNERIVIDEPFVDDSLFCTIGFVAKEMKLGWNSTGRRSGYVKTGADVSSLHFRCGYHAWLDELFARSEDGNRKAASRSASRLVWRAGR